LLRSKALYSRPRRSEAGQDCQAQSSPLRGEPRENCQTPSGLLRSKQGPNRQTKSRLLRRESGEHSQAASGLRRSESASHRPGSTARNATALVHPLPRERRLRGNRIDGTIPASPLPAGRYLVGDGQLVIPNFRAVLAPFLWAGQLWTNSPEEVGQTAEEHAENKERCRGEHSQLPEGEPNFRLFAHGGKNGERSGIMARLICSPAQLVVPLLNLLITSHPIPEYRAAIQILLTSTAPILIEFIVLPAVRRSAGMAGQSPLKQAGTRSSWRRWTTRTWSRSGKTSGTCDGVASRVAVLVLTFHPQRDFLRYSKRSLEPRTALCGHAQNAVRR
jgi:hypothetical protein